MDLYAENILDHYRHPRGKESLPVPTVEHTEENLACGDRLTVQLCLEGGRVTTIGWDGSGCAISQAAMSMLAEEMSGKTRDDLEKLTAQDIYALLGVPIGPRRTKCALLCLLAVKNALRRARGLPAQGWADTVRVPDAA